MVGPPTSCRGSIGERFGLASGILAYTLHASRRCAVRRLGLYVEYVGVEFATRMGGCPALLVCRFR